MTPGWFAGFGSLESEISTVLDISGRWPKDVDGRLYRIGPARNDLFGQRCRHWFDGDGMVHLFNISAGTVTYRNRFVDTAKKRAEEAAGQRLFGAFGAPPAGTLRERFRRGYSASANTNIVWHGGKLLALWEQGRPYRLDPESLDTLGEEDFDGALGPGQAFSAHPKIDPRTGEMVNFGVSYGLATRLRLYVVDASGALRSLRSIRLPDASMIHDFAITASKIVVIVAPMVLPRLPLGLLARKSSFAESLRWRPQLGARVAVIDRASGECRWFAAGPFMSFHTVNAFDQERGVTLDLCAYEDGRIVAALGDVMKGRWQPLNAWPTRLELNLTAGSADVRRLGDRSLELPRVGHGAHTNEHQLFFGLTPSDDDPGGFPTQPARFDVRTGATKVFPLPSGHYAGEPVFVPAAGATGEDEGYLLTLVLNTVAGHSYLALFNASDSRSPAIATARLPHIVPFGFHGSFVPAR